MISVIATDPEIPSIAAMIEQLDGYQLSLYPEESNHLVSIEELTAENVYFVAAYEGPDLIGCGAIKYVDCACCDKDIGGYGEIKRVFVKTEARGKGVSKEIMAKLESNARYRKVEVIRLETGIHQPEAIGLYARLGYRRRGPFGEYPDDPVSVFMERRLLPEPECQE